MTPLRKTNLGSRGLICVVSLCVLGTVVSAPASPAVARFALQSPTFAPTMTFQSQLMTDVLYIDKGDGNHRMRNFEKQFARPPHKLPEPPPAPKKESNQTGFRVCDKTGQRIGVAIGYNHKGGAETLGWWNLNPHSCELTLKGDLEDRYYYVYAVDYDKGGAWSGHHYMCTREKMFTIHGSHHCLARGYDRTGFFKVDAENRNSWTVQLTDTAK